MKNKKSFGVLLSLVSVLVLAGFFFGSCEIGLGPAVDTQAPSVTIDSPGVDVVIRDSFAIKGTWSDDGEIVSLKAVLKRTDGTGSPINFDGEVIADQGDDKSGSWNIIVKPIEQQILDGSYEVTISIKDKGEHVTTQTRTFKIDNTAPLIVLQRPSTKSDATSVDTYGQSFTLTGQAADDNNIEHIYVNIYSDSSCTESSFIRTVDLKNVPPTIEQDVAKFELGVDNDYAAIYGYSDKGHGTVGRYCTINAYDGSQRYPIEGEQTEEDKLGNSTNVYYLYNDIATAILSDTKITEVYHMLDGTCLLKDASRSAAVDDIKDILKENAITIGSFSLNPDNNPIFTVSGQSPLTGNGGDFTNDQSHYISNGLTVVVEVSPGLDAIPLDAESLKVYFQECDLNGEPLPEAEKVYSDSTYSLSGSSYKFETLISTTVGLRIGANYILNVEGHDQKGNEVIPKTGKYGFHLASNASAPILTVTSPAENLVYKKKGDVQEFAGTISVEEGKPTLTINIGDDNYYTYQVTDEDLLPTETGKLYQFSFTVPAGGDHGFDQNTSAQYGFTIKASSDGLASAENRTIIYDVDAPVVTIQQITPTAYKYIDESGKRETDADGNPVKYLNGLINVKLTISDAKSGVDVTTQKPKYEFFLGNSLVPQTLPTYILDPYGQEINNIDTTAWLNQNGTPYTGPVTFKVTAYDIAGNEKVETVVYQVDQETDKPVLLPYDANSTTWTMLKAGNEPHGINEITTEAGVQIKNSKNIFINGSQLNIKLIDDDGINNLKYYYGKLTVDTANNFAFTPITDFGSSKGDFTDNAHSTETTYPCNLPSESGYYQFKVVVTDVNNKTTTVGPFVVKTTPAGAEIVVTQNKTHIKQGSGDSIKNTIIISSDQAPFTVYRKLKNEETWTEIHTINLETNKLEYTYEDTVTPTDTTNYDYKVTDCNTHESNVVDIKCTVDGGKPTVNAESGLPNREKTKLSSFTFKGKAEDKATDGHLADTPSGIQKILLKVSNGTDNTAADYKYRTVTVIGTNDWYYELSYKDEIPANEETGAIGNTWKDVFEHEGKKYVTITVIDNVGNESDDYINKEFVYDTSNPILTVDSTSVRNFIPTGGYDITGTAYDTLAYNSTQNLKSLEITEYKLNTSNVYEKTSGINPKPILFTTGNNWKAHVPFGEVVDGTYKYEIKATDSVGNTTSWSKDGIKVDTFKPVVKIEPPSTSGYSPNNTITFKGFIGEENKDTCTATLQKWNGTAWENVANGNYDLNVDSGIIDPAQTNWSQKIYDLENAKYRLYVKAVDQARNEEEAYSDEVTVDTTAPTSTIYGTNFVKDNGVALSETENINTTQGEIIYYAKEAASGAAYTISGVINETNYDPSKVKLNVKKPDGKDDVDITASLSLTGKNWSYSYTSTETDGKDDGAYKYTLSITDKAGNRTDYTINVTYDTQKPTLTIDEPVQNSFSGTTPIVANGSIKDSGIGLKEFKYSTDNGTNWKDWKDSGNKTIDRKASSWQMNFAPTTQGEIKLIMKAVDYLGHEFVTEERRFSFDEEPPHVTASSNAVNGYVTSGNIVLTGKAWDTNKFDSISILDESNSGQITYTETSTTAISITEPRASAKTEGTAVDWTLTLPTSGTGAIENGSHKFTITAKDDAGRTASPASIIIIVDTVAPTMTLGALPSRTDTQAASFTFRGTGSDVTSGVEKVELKIANANDSKSRTVKATGKENWYYSVVFEDETPAANETGASGNTWKEVFADEGVKKVTLKVYDKAGLSEDKFTLGEETTEVTEKTFTFDKANPVITLNQGTVLEYMPDGGFDITGTVSDSYKLAGTTEGTKCVTVEEYYKATAADSWPTAAQQTQEFNATNINNHSGAISIHVPLKNGTTRDGRYKYKITVKDSMDNKGTYSTSEIIVDKTKPVVTITTPSSATSHKEQNAIHEQSFKFIGGFDEANISGIYYKVVKSGESAPEKPTSNVISESSWTAKGFTKVSESSSSWNTFQSFTTGNTGDYCEGENYTIYVYGVDKATNVSNVATQVFDVDMSAPEIKTQVMEEGGSYTDLTVDSTQVKTKTYTFRYYAKDTYGLKKTETVVVKKDGDTLSTATSTTAPYYAIGTADVDGYKVITITVPTDVKQDGLYEYTISAVDKVGKTTEVNRSIRLDRYGPDLTVQTPDLTGYQFNESVKVSGSSEDDSGTLAVYYAFDKATEPAKPATGIDAKIAANWENKGWTLANGTTSWNFTVTGVEAQTKNLYIVAVDKNGLYETPENAVVKVDKADPKSSFTKPTAYVKGGKLVLTGTAWDENGIKEVKVSYGINGAYSNSNSPKILISETTYKAQTESEAKTKLAAAKSSTTTATWKSEITLADEKYNFKIEITDDAGKVKTETCEVTMDNTPPKVSSPVMDWGSSTVTPHNISTATLSFTVTETNVKSVSYFIDNKSNGYTDIEGKDVPSNKWSSISSDSNSYSTNLTFGDGDGNIYIKVEDMAGNVAYGTAQTYNVDTAKPDVCTIVSVNGETDTSSIMVNGRSSVPFIVKATDFNAKYSYNSTTLRYEQKGADPAQIASVSLFSVGSNKPSSTVAGTKTNATTGEWTIVIPTEVFSILSTGSQPVSVVVKDTAGNSQNFSNLFTLTLDKTAPTVGIITPKDAGDATGTQVNGTIKLEGTAKDTGGAELSTIDICYYVDATNGWQWHSRITEELSNWTSSEIDTTKFTDKAKVTFVAIATDTAGNRKTDSSGVDKTVVVYDTDGTTVKGLKPAATVLPTDISTAIKVEVDQDTDRPLIKFTNLQNKGTDTTESFVLMFGSDSMLEGIVSDDDTTATAAIDTFIASSSAFTKKTDGTIDLTGWTPTEDGNSVTYTKTDCGSTTYNKVTGDYSFTPANTADGTKSVYFYVKDNGGKEFCTNLGSAEEHLAQPKQQYKSEGSVKDNSAALSYLSDSKAPEISSVSLQAFNKESGSTDADKEGKATGLGATCIVGGTKKTFVEIAVTATDDNNISEIEVELSDGTIKKTLKKSVTNDFKASGNVYTTKRIKLSDFTAIANDSTGNVTVKIKVIDGAGLYSNQESLFVVDKKPAKITNITQSAEDLYGSVKFAVSGQPSETDVSKVYYGFTSSTTKPTTWTEIQNQKLSINLVFDGDLNSTTDGVHGKTLRDYILDAYGLTDTQLSANDATKDLYIHFKVEDECGNIGYSYQNYSVIPNGDLPTLELTYPENITSATKVGGTLRCIGTTNIGPGQTVVAVYAQIDVGAIPGSTWNSDWEKALTDFTDKYTVENTGVKNNADLTRGIKVSGAPYSWNMAINGSTEFNTDPDKKLAVRFFAVGSTGKASAVTTFDIVIDPNAPIFSDLKLIQKTEGKSQAYSDDMWIKGQWYLTGKLTDDNGVKYISYFDNANVETILVDRDKTDSANKDLSGDITAAGNGLVTKVGSNKASGGNSAYDYTFEIPIGNTNNGEFGSITYRIDAIDATGDNNTATKTFTVNFDNKAPVFKAVENPTSNTELATTGLSIKQSNNGYTIDGKFDEEGTANANQSGFGRIVMYFTRTVDGTTHIVDPSVTKVKASNNDNKNNYLALTGLTLDSTDGIYWKQMSASEITETCKLTVTSLPSYVRKGGVCKIDGILYTITGISGNEVTVKGVLDNTKTAKTVYFTPALVIDNMAVESLQSGKTYDGIYSSSDDKSVIQNGDGDWLIEGVSKSGSSYPWTVTINSANILDGPIDIHFTAFDAAGNVATKTYSGSIANNAPRIAGVTVWTDYNGDSTGWRSTQAGYEDETKSYYATQVRPTINGKQVYRSKDVVDSLIVSSDGKVTDTTKGEGKAFMKITDQVKVIPEIVGGNGALGYTFNLSGNGLPTSGVPAGTGSALKKDDGTTTVNGTDASASLPTKTDADSVTYIDGNTDGVITFDTTNVISKLSNSSTENPTWFNIKIWDRTEGATQYTNTLNCEMKIALNVQYTDNTSPNTYVNNLYWNSATDNSVYIDPSNDQLKGHVELIKDIKDLGSTSAMATNYGLDDDKVSGIVVFRGTAYDNKRLSEISWTLQNSSGNDIWPDVGYIKATYSNGSWSTSGSPTGIPYCKIDISTDAKDGAYFNGNGHKVAWTLTINTNWVKNNIGGTEYPVCKDAVLTMNAKDTAGKTTSTTVNKTSTDDTVRNSPTYKMDIVPYIVDIETRLSKKDTSNPTVYSRTAKGHYPIASDEGAITLKGYNLAFEDGDVTIPAATVAAMTSGAYIYPVYDDPDDDDNDIMTINNMNNNDAHGDFVIEDGFAESKKVTNMYNRMPNSTTNLTLTDDVYFDVWDFTLSAATTSGKIAEPVMRLNPSNNMIGFAFANGSSTFSMPNGSTNSYERWQINYANYNRINLAYDKNGNAHTISVGLDTEPNDGLAGRMQYINSQWRGNGQKKFNWNKSRTVSLESLGQNFDILRFGRPALALSNRDDPTAYIAYYDSNNDQIRFRYGTITDHNGSRSNQYNQIADDKGANNRNPGTDTTDAGNSYGQHGWFDAHPDYYSLLAGGSTGNGTSEFVDLDVISGEAVDDDIVVIVWFDGTNLMYTYRSGKKSDTDANSNGVTAVTTGNQANQHGAWSKPVKVFDGVGQYCTIRVDALGGIHIAAFDRPNANLCYAYMSGYNQTSNIKTAVVDAYSQIGKYISLDTALIARPGTTDKYNVIPYITYYADGMNGLPKLAYIPEGINPDNISVKNGADKTTNLFSSDWEVTLLPTNSEVNEDNMNVAVWKTSAGVKNTQAKPEGASFTDATTGSTSGSSYANGNSDLVCGYGITKGASGFIETAQRVGIPKYE